MKEGGRYALARAVLMLIALLVGSRPTVKEGRRRKQWCGSQPGVVRGRVFVPGTLRSLALSRMAGVPCTYIAYPIIVCIL